MARSGESWWNPTAVVLASSLAIPAALLPLVPADYRPWNFAAFGAIALFTAARGGRLGLPLAVILAIGSKLVFDLINYDLHAYHSDYEPSLVVYGCLALYGLVGWTLARRSENPLRLAGATFLGSMAFFLVTNFFSWQRFDLPYDRSPLGLIESYWMALPFWRGTLISDVLFSAGLFGAYAVLSRVGFLAGRPALVRIPVEPRSDAS